MKLLVLFDIDGTLVRKTGRDHADALVHGVRRVLGVETSTEGIPVHGMLDQDILMQMLTREGVGAVAIREAMAAIQREAEEYYLRACPDLRDKACPGANELLRELERRAVPMVLVTGNLTRIGWKKLERAGMAHYFAFGSFSETAETRGGLARNAIRRAREEGLIGEGARVVLVGDAPSDVLAAKESGARALAVATGVSTAEELRACGADEVLSSLHEFLHCLTVEESPVQ